MIGKALLPRSLFGRALLILVLPIVLVQMIMAYVFFERHWDNITRRMSGVLASETAFLTQQAEALPGMNKSSAMQDFERLVDIDIYLDPPDTFTPEGGTREFSEFQELLRSQIARPFTVRRIEGDQMIEIRIFRPEQRPLD